MDTFHNLAPIGPHSKLIIVGKREPFCRIQDEKASTRKLTGFFKFASALTGHASQVRLPRRKGFDAEAVLGVVIGKRAERVTTAQSLDYVGGFTLLLDITDREAFDKEGKTNNCLFAKNHRSLTPIGPRTWVPPDFQDVQLGHVTLRQNGAVRQRFDLDDLAYGIEEVVAYWSRVGLEPGDVLGLGAAIVSDCLKDFETPVVIGAGDSIELEASPIGVLKIEIVEPNATSEV